MPPVYLDNNATTPVLPEIVEAMRPYLTEQFGNASSAHRWGQQARGAVERARANVAKLLGAAANEIIFTGGGTEGDNQALFCTLELQRGDHIITSSIEHHAVLHASDRLRELGYEITIVPVDSECRVNPDDVRRALRPTTRLISIMTANNETGVLQPVTEIGKIAREAGVLFHTDAVQAAGKVPLNVVEIGCDLLSISGHKMHAPKGIGALYIRKGTKLGPLIFGGGQERSLRAGTENVAAIAGFGKAAEMSRAWLSSGGPERMATLRDRFEQQVLAAIEAAIVNGAGAARVWNTSNIAFEGAQSEALVIALDLEGLAVSGGSACSSGAVEPSHVLTAMGMPVDRARSSVRFSLGKQNTEAEIEFALKLLPEAVARLRDLSPVWKRRTAAPASL